METLKFKTRENADAHAFNENASRLLLERGDAAVVDLFARLDYACQAKGDGTFRMPCPVCKVSLVFIGTNGRTYPLFWRCLSQTCPTTRGGYVKNLLGLVRACVDGRGLGTAYKAIAGFLGVSCPFNITNMSQADVDRAVAGDITQADEVAPRTREKGPSEIPDSGRPVFVVPGRSLKTMFDEAGVEAVIAGQPMPTGRRIIEVDDPLEWDFLGPEEIRRQAHALMNQR